MTETKTQLISRIKEQYSLVSAAVLGLGVGLIISIVFSKIGIWFVVAGLVLKVFESGISRIMLNLIKFQPVICPICRNENQVRTNVTTFSCDNCGRLLIKERGRARLHTHLKLVVDNSRLFYQKRTV